LTAEAEETITKYLNEKAARELFEAKTSAAEKKVAGLEAELAEKKAFASRLETQITDSHSRLKVAEEAQKTAEKLLATRVSECEKIISLYKEDMRAEMAKAQDLFVYHRELLETHCKDTSAAVKARVLKSFDDEFGAFNGKAVEQNDESGSAQEY
jgi:hypothetical protein